MIAAHGSWLTGDAGGGAGGGPGGWRYILVLAGRRYKQTLTRIKHYIMQHLGVQVEALMSEAEGNIISGDEVCDSIMFPGLAASSQGLTRMLS